MSWTNNDPVCPTDCSVVTPAVDFSDCNPSINAAQIKNIYVTNPGYPLANWEDPSEWAARVSNSSSTVSAIRRYTVIGSKPRPTSTIKKISHDRSIAGTKQHVLNIKIDETNDMNYENIVRASECGGQRQMWYETMGGKLYGGNEGIPSSIVIDDVIVEDLEDIERFEGEITWSAKFHPERISSPIA